jgi:hypothetical protein
MASEFLKSIQNYFDTVHNYNNFVGFKSRSNRSTAGVVAARYDSWAVNGDDPSGEGSPKLNADGTQELDSNGNSTGNDIKPANSFTQRWGDNESYQVGNNYTELEGDAVVVVVGNTSTRRKGWTNNVTDGLTFNTQIGGTVATSLFAVTTMLGFRCNTFVGADVAINAAATVKLTCGGYYSFGKANEWGLAKEKTDALNERTEIVATVKRLIGEETSTVLSSDMIVAETNSLTCMNREVKAAFYQVTAGVAEIEGKVVTTIKSTGITTLEGTAGLYLKTSGIATVNGTLIKIG